MSTLLQFVVLGISIVVAILSGFAIWDGRNYLAIWMILLAIWMTLLAIWQDV